MTSDEKPASFDQAGRMRPLTRCVETLIALWSNGLDRLCRYPSRVAVKNSEGTKLFLLGRSKARAGEYEEATRMFAQAAELEPTLADALEAYGEMLAMYGDKHRANSMYQAYRRLQHDAGRKASDRPLFYRSTGRITTEVAAYTDTVRYIDNQALLYTILGNAHLAQSEPERALICYAFALARKPGDAGIVARKADALLALGRYADALESFDVALAKNPADVYALSGRAIARLAVGQIAEADADWRDQLALLPLERTSARACIALRLADYEAALHELEQLVRREPDDAYWQLYFLTAAKRTGRSLHLPNFIVSGQWPAILIALHNGLASTEAVLQQANDAEQRAEAQFQLGVRAVSRDPSQARGHWQQVADRAAPTQLEYAAARHELALLGAPARGEG